MSVVVTPERRLRSFPREGEGLALDEKLKGQCKNSGVTRNQRKGEKSWRVFFLRVIVAAVEEGMTRELAGWRRECPFY